MRKIKKNKKLSFKGLIIIFTVASLFFSVGYSYLVQDLTINSIVNIDNSAIDDSISTDDLKLKYEQNKWYNDGTYYYQYDMVLENLCENDIKDWKIIIEFSDNIEMFNAWGMNYQVINNKLIISGGLINQSEILTFGFQIKSLADDLLINDVILNGTKIIIIDNPEENQNEFFVTTKIINSWPSGDSSYHYQYEITFNNNSDYDISSWQFTMILEDNTNLESVWGANYIDKDSEIFFSNVDYNGTIKAHESITFGGIFSSTKTLASFEFKDVVGK